MLGGTHNFKAFRGSARRSPISLPEGSFAGTLESATMCTLTKVSVRLLRAPAASSATFSGIGVGGGIGGGSGSGSVATTARAATVAAATAGSPCDVGASRQLLARQLLDSDARAVEVTLDGDRCAYTHVSHAPTRGLIGTF
jgi:hypothetical protein